MYWYEREREREREVSRQGREQGLICLCFLSAKQAGGGFAESCDSDEFDITLIS